MNTQSFERWTPTSLPSQTTLSTITNTDTAALQASVSSAINGFATAENFGQFQSFSQMIRGGQASMRIISAQDVLATATNDQVQAQATQAIFNSTLNLDDLAFEKNLYKYHLSYPANIIYFILYTIIFVYTALMIIKSRYHWYNVTYFCGYGLEFIGFLGRIMCLNDVENYDAYLMQYISLTLAPAFIMGGIYFLFAQMVIAHGREYSVLKPMWYSYLFITCDVLSLLIQAGGGASASVASQKFQDTSPGTNTIIAGIVFQTFAMTIFVLFWFEFLNRLYFKNKSSIEGDYPYKKRSIKNFLKLLCHTKDIREYKTNVLDQFYNPKFIGVRQMKLFQYMPLALTVSVVVIYIRCVFRVVELSEGWQGYLITHEVYIMVLDALMITIAGLIAVPFHPVWVFGKKNVLKLATIKKNLDETPTYEEQEADTDTGLELDAERKHSGENSSHLKQNEQTSNLNEKFSDAQNTNLEANNSNPFQKD